MAEPESGPLRELCKGIEIALSPSEETDLTRMACDLVLNGVKWRFMELQSITAAIVALAYTPHMFLIQIWIQTWHLVKHVCAYDQKLPYDQKLLLVLMRFYDGSVFTFLSHKY